MAKLENYNGSVLLMSGIKQYGHDGALVEANAVQTKEDGTRLDQELEEIYELLNNGGTSGDNITPDKILIWQPNTKYYTGDYVLSSHQMFGNNISICCIYSCSGEHTSSDNFSDDYDSVKWDMVKVISAFNTLEDARGNVIHEHYATKEELADAVIGESSIAIDQSYNSKSENAQSGIAVAEALLSKLDYQKVIEENIDFCTGDYQLYLVTGRGNGAYYLLSLSCAEGQIQTYPLKTIQYKFSQEGICVRYSYDTGDSFWSWTEWEKVALESDIKTEIENIVKTTTKIDDDTDDEYLPTTLAVKGYADKLKPLYFQLDLDADYAVIEGQIDYDTLKSAFDESAPHNRTKYGRNTIININSPCGYEHISHIETLSQGEVLYFYFTEYGKTYKISVDSSNTWTTEVVEYATKEDLENIGGGSSIAVDDTLSVEGAAADAKAVGDKIKEMTPIRGTDYWTDEDIAGIKSYIDETIQSGTPSMSFTAKIEEGVLVIK